MTSQTGARRRSVAVAAAFVALTFGVLVPVATALATNLSDFSVTPATGGARIPASSAGGSWTPLVGPVINVTPYSNPDTLPAGTTFTLTLPPNFAWDTAVTAGPKVSVAPDAPAGWCALVPSSLAYAVAGGTVRNLSFTLSGSHDVACLISFSGLRVRPISGDPGAGTGGSLIVDWSVPGLGAQRATGGSIGMTGGSNAGALPLAASAGAVALVAAGVAALLLVARRRGGA